MLFRSLHFRKYRLLLQFLSCFCLLLYIFIATLQSMQCNVCLPPNMSVNMPVLKLIFPGFSLPHSRPDTSFLWFMNPLKTLKYILWKNWKWKILKIFLFLCFVAFLALFLYTVPEATVNKMWGLWCGWRGNTWLVESRLWLANPWQDFTMHVTIYGFVRSMGCYWQNRQKQLGGWKCVVWSLIPLLATGRMERYDS